MSKSFDRLPEEMKKMIQTFLSDMDKKDLEKWILDHLRPNDIIKIISEK